MNSKPHPDTEEIIVNCAVITVSDTRSQETDKSGQVIQKLLTDYKHQIVAYNMSKMNQQPLKLKLLI